jgi:serine protease SohB
VINLESPGGMVHTYGLAASQLHRITSAGIPLTVAVDKVAASGGYLMACVANKIIAAPFAIVGSIGVLAQIPNFNRALKKVDVDYEIMTAGEHKAPISMFGEITEKGKNKLQQELEETHELFKGFIHQHRPQVPLAEVATGEVWYGQQAIKHQLIDEVQTFDDYLMAKRHEHNIYQVSFAEKKSLQEKLGIAVEHGISRSLLSFFNKEQTLRVTKEIS